MTIKYQLPEFLTNIVTQAAYEKWLHRKAQGLFRKYKKKADMTATISEYKIAIHKVVDNCCGRDAYSQEQLDWHLLSTYDNEKSKKEGRAYKRKFDLLPSIDHVSGDGTGASDFKICSWRTIDSKNDMSMDEYVDLCKKIIKYNS